MVEMPLSARAPETLRRSLTPLPMKEGSLPSLMTLVLPFNVRLLLNVSVPAAEAVPGEICVPVPAEVLPFTAPEPESVWPLLRLRPPAGRLASSNVPAARAICAELAMDPLGPKTRLPALTVVAPEYGL